MTHNLGTLEYAVDGAPRRLPRVLAAGAVLLPLLIAGGWLLYPRAAPHLLQWEVLRRQARVMNWQWPADHVAYTEDERRIGQLKGRAEYRPARYSRSAWRGAETNSSAQPLPGWPAPLRYLDDATMRLGAGMHSPGHIFRHRRVTPAGQERLVLMGLGLYAVRPDLRVALITQAVIAPATRTPGSRPMAKSAMAEGIALGASDRLTLFSGHADPTDASRLIIPYELNGAGGALLGQLHDNDTVTLQVRDGPAKLADPSWAKK